MEDQRQIAVVVHGYDPNSGHDFIEETREVEVLCNTASIRIVLNCPDTLHMSDRPDINIEWQPSRGWVVYLHPDADQDPVVIAELNPNSVELVDHRRATVRPDPRPATKPVTKRRGRLLEV